jgi:hypothetical protein
MLRQMFCAPELKERFSNWKHEARDMLENFRGTYDFWSHAPDFVELVRELNAVSPIFLGMVEDA